MSAQKLITEHLGLWTSAITKKSTSGRGSNGKIELTGVKKLRELILELAVRGRLVEQDPKDEPARKLLNKTKALREELSKEIKPRRQKKIVSTEQIDKPFELPSSWIWALLPEVSDYSPGKTPSTKDPKFWNAGESGIPWVSIADLNHNGTVQNTAKAVTQEAADKVFRSEPIAPGTILMSFKLTVGKISIAELPVYHNEAIISIFPYKGMNRDYLFKVLPMLALGGNTKRAIMGNTLNATSLAQILIPLPPKEEQNRIVQKVDQLMDLCDRLEEQTSDQLEAHETLVDTLLGTLTQSENATELADNWARLSAHFDTLFTTEQSIDKLKQAILQLAVMGRLVEQDAGDDPVGDVLLKLENKKTQMVKEGVFKKPKEPPAANPEEAPFNLPKNWAWVRLGNVVCIRGGKRVSNGYKLTKKETPYVYVRVSDFKDGSIDDSDLHYIDQPMRNKISQYIITSNDIYMTIVGATIGKCGLVPEKFNNMNLTENAARITPIIEATKSFLYKCLSSKFCQEQFLDKTNQVGVQKMALSRLGSTYIPFPPVEEQQRIVQKVDELMALCDKLKERLSQASETRCQLAEAVVKEAVA